MVKAFDDFLDVLRDLKTILSWYETWIPSLIVLGIIAFWLIFAFALYLPNPWRTIVIWGMFLGIVALIPEH
jgi:hypothetical protein